MSQAVCMLKMIEYNKKCIMHANNLLSQEKKTLPFKIVDSH